MIGSGPGGASLAQRLAPTGKRMLILERGEYLPRSEKSWSSQAVFVDAERDFGEVVHAGGISPASALRVADKIEERQ